MLPKLALPLAALAALTSAAVFPPGGVVKEVNARNFDTEVLGKERTAVVAFTAPWCGHCKNLAPQYTKAASSLENLVTFYNVDCDADLNKPLCARYQVQGFPTIKSFTRGSKLPPHDYNGPRQAGAISDWAGQEVRNTVKRLSSLAELRSWVAEDESPRVLLLTTKPPTPTLLRVLAIDLSSAPFGILRLSEKTADVPAALDIGISEKPAKPTVLVLKHGLAGASQYSGPLRYKELKRWIESEIPNASKKRAEPSKSSTRTPSKSTASASASASASSTSLRLLPLHPSSLPSSSLPSSCPPSTSQPCLLALLPPTDPSYPSSLTTYTSLLSTLRSLASSVPSLQILHSTPDEVVHKALPDLSTDYPAFACVAGEKYRAHVGHADVEALKEFVGKCARAQALGKDMWFAKARQPEFGELVKGAGAAKSAASTASVSASSATEVAKDAASSAAAAASETLADAAEHASVSASSAADAAKSTLAATVSAATDAAASGASDASVSASSATEVAKDAAPSAASGASGTLADAAGHASVSASSAAHAAKSTLGAAAEGAKDAASSASSVAHAASAATGQAKAKVAGGVRDAAEGVREGGEWVRDEL